MVPREYEYQECGPSQDGGDHREHQQSAANTGSGHGHDNGVGANRLGPDRLPPGCAGMLRALVLIAVLPGIEEKQLSHHVFRRVEDFVGNTPLVRLQSLPGDTSNTIAAKLEGNNPAGSVKDRPAISMIRHAEQRGEIQPGDTLVEATSGNTGIALAMAAAMRGYRMKLIMPATMSAERRAVMYAFGAEIILVSADDGMEGARDLAARMQDRGEGRVLDQFSNPDNPLAHYQHTGPEIWRDSGRQLTHFVSSMGTTGTIMGVSRYLKECDPDIQVIGVQPAEGAQIPGIRRWPQAYLPAIYEPSRVDRLLEVSQQEAEQTTRSLAAREGIFCGISSGGAVAAALRLSEELEHAVIAVIICDRGDRYLSTGVFPAG